MSNFLEKVFDMDFLQKYFYGVFELPLSRNAQKRTKKKSQEKKSRMVGGWVWDLANARGGVRRFFLAAPRGGGGIGVAVWSVVANWNVVLIALARRSY